MSQPSKAEILSYNDLLSIASGKLEPQYEEAVPSFMINDSLAYFADKEEFENCAAIKRFFDSKYPFVINVSRQDW